ncbi:hypothetical protein MRB53_007497 [Persea americana]|uniref:Uncharacterized protein n=1 Tax=Persea americana TaxID=3435 RepID=A0ACC2MK79_PERAE|nr:hypothetical protein MRB53_007497 [Persea americana]
MRNNNLVAVPSGHGHSQCDTCISPSLIVQVTSIQHPRVNQLRASLSLVGKYHKKQSSSTPFLPQFMENACLQQHGSKRRGTGLKLQLLLLTPLTNFTGDFQQELQLIHTIFAPSLFFGKNNKAILSIRTFNGSHMLELIFHRQMLEYPCLKANPAFADAIFLLYYAGIIFPLS